MSIDHKAEAQKWFVKASQDEKAAKLLLQSNGPEETVCFLLQQWAEKYLKGYLSFHNQRLEKTHDLKHLIELCSHLDNEFSTLEDMAILLNSYYIGTRYPLDLEVTLTPEEALKSAQAIVNSVKKKLGIPL